MLKLFKAGWILITNILNLSPAGKKNNSERDSNDTFPLSFYHYSCGVDFPNLIELEY